MLKELKIRLILPMIFVLFLPMKGIAKPSDKYTKDHPLIIMCDWAFPPYEFSNDNGQPDGYSVELLKIILEQMDVNYKFVMKECFQAAEAFERQEADLIVSPSIRFQASSTSHYFISNCVQDYYRLTVASLNTKHIDKSLKQLDKSKTILLRNFDYGTRSLLNSVAPYLVTEFRSPNEALAAIANEKESYFIWGEEPTKWIIKEMNLTNIRISEIDLPVTEIHFIGHDKQLIDEIDDRYSRLEQSGQIERLYDKWFRPERVHNDESPVAIYIMLIILAAAIGLFLLNRLAMIRAKAATRRSKELESMMLQALSMSQYSIVEYNVQTSMFHNRHGKVLPQEGATRSQLLAHIHPENRDCVSRFFTDLLKGKVTSVDLNVRWCPFEIEGQPEVNEEDPWQDVQGHAIVETDQHNRIKHIICAIKNVTEEIREEQANRLLGNHYTKIFDTSLVAMSFYDKNGWLINLNQNMRDLCGFDGEGERYFRETNLFENPFFRNDLNPKSKEHFHACQHMHYNDMGLDKYLEVRIQPVTGDDGEITYYIVTTRDISDERNIYMEQRHYDQELNATNKQINSYEQQLQYLLKHCDMFVWEFDLTTRNISFSRSLRNPEFVESRDTYMSWLVENEREAADRNLIELMMKGQDFNVVHHFSHTPVNDHPSWYALCGTPVYKDKQISGYIGIARDITELMLIQEKLRRETKRADESGKLKSVFLANMTHEIRTPLNAIVGFSDLLQVVDDSNDRREFIRIIRNNCDMLIRLIDDIIEASNIGQGPLAIERQDIDFAIAFNDICQTLAQRVQEPGVQFIVDNPYSSFRTCLDKGRMQQVITNFTTNAVKYTHEGHIKVGYCYLSFTELKKRIHSPQIAKQSMPFSGIFMYCEDTGAGIPREKQSAVFDRFVKLNAFVQGTGLGLSICKSIAERCGGRIGVESEGEGHGSTFWIWIPCEKK